MCAILDSVHFLLSANASFLSKEPIVMSRSSTQTFTCPCGQVFTSTIYEYVNIAQQPQLRYTVLAGLLNVSTCPTCGRRAAVATPFIYSDPAYNLLAYVHPRADAPEEARLLILEKLRSVYVDVPPLLRKRAMANRTMATGDARCPLQLPRPERCLPYR